MAKEKKSPKIEQEMSLEEAKAFRASLYKALWLHLKTIGMNSPENFSEGLANFGLKKVK